MTDKLPQITQVAILYDGRIFALPKPNRHHHIIRMMGGIPGPDIQGFLDENGNFLNREDAYKLAVASGQINRSPGDYQGGKLFSEDLW